MKKMKNKEKPIEKEKDINLKDIPLIEKKDDNTFILSNPIKEKEQKSDKTEQSKTLSSAILKHLKFLEYQDNYEKIALQWASAFLTEAEITEIIQKWKLPFRYVEIINKPQANLFQSFFTLAFQEGFISLNLYKTIGENQFKLISTAYLFDLEEEEESEEESEEEYLS